MKRLIQQTEAEETDNTGAPQGPTVHSVSDTESEATVKERSVLATDSDEMEFESANESTETVITEEERAKRAKRGKSRLTVKVKTSNTKVEKKKRSTTNKLKKQAAAISQAIRKNERRKLIKEANRALNAGLDLSLIHI